jgi:hypothetical protein
MVCPWVRWTALIAARRAPQSKQDNDNDDDDLRQDIVPIPSISAMTWVGAAVQERHTVNLRHLPHPVMPISLHVTRRPRRRSRPRLTWRGGKRL